MRSVKFDNEDRYIRDFLSLPKKIYSSGDNMEDPDTMKKILLGQHPLSKYFHLDKFLIYDDSDRPVGRFIITTYENDKTAYFGFYECLDNDQYAKFLFDTAYEFVSAGDYDRILGPVDASFWIKYRLKINRFDILPYTGEPYNRDYYFRQFKDNGFIVCEHYISNEFRSVDETYVNEKFEQRFEEFTGMGYSIVSPKVEEFDTTIDAVYKMVTELYSDFPVFKDVKIEDFREVFKSYKSIMNMSMTKIAYYKGEPVGFYVSVPDYGNMVYHLNPVNIAKIMKLRKKPKKYVMLYMGVDQNHRGLGKAIVYAIMKELMASGLPSIGALARDGKVTQDYAHDDVTDVYEYVLLERKIIRKDTDDEL
ncbi:MAG: hypothetical protein IKE53_03490 [Clostridiales bacterium]|nr:hypothetical protein [Clostridiales bacterium]